MSQEDPSQAARRFSEDGTGAVPRPYLYFLTTLAAVGGFLFGYDLSIIAGAIPFLNGEFSPSAFLLGFGASSAIIGCILGAMSLGGLADRWGRKKAFYLCAALLGISVLGTAFPRGMLDFSIFRIVGGMGVGLVSIVSLMYIAEVAPARLRGRLVWGHQLAIVIGSLAALCVSYLFANASWRGVFASELAPILLLVIGLRWIPESPRWLAQRKREREAHTVFAGIGGLQHADLEMGRISVAPGSPAGDAAGRGRCRDQPGPSCLADHVRNLPNPPSRQGDDARLIEFMGVGFSRFLFISGHDGVFPGASRKRGVGLVDLPGSLPFRPGIRMAPVAGDKGQIPGRNWSILAFQ